MRVESGGLRVEQLAKLLKNAFALHYFKDKFHEAIAAELVANGVRLEEKQATSKASEQFASDNNVPSKWIPVTERLPGKMGQYVCRYVFGENMDYPFYQVLWYFANLEKPHFQHEGSMGLTVTHWMPLPEPPKGE